MTPWRAHPPNNNLWHGKSQWREGGGLDPPETNLSLDDERFREWVTTWAEPNSQPIRRRAWNVLRPPDSLVRYYEIEAGRAGNLWIAVGLEAALMLDTDELGVHRVALYRYRMD